MKPVRVKAKKAPWDVVSDDVVNGGEKPSMKRFDTPFENTRERWCGRDNQKTIGLEPT